MKNKLMYLILHCTATPEGRLVTKDDIIHWHTDPKSKGGRGWNRPGYRDMIYLDGQLVNLIPFNSDDFVDLWEISNGVAGLNGNSAHIVYVGGMDASNKLPKDTRTEKQLDTMEVYVKYMVKCHPDILVLGHNEAPNAHGKACPSFDVAPYLRSIGIPEVNIYQKPGAASLSQTNANTSPEDIQEA